MRPSILATALLPLFLLACACGNSAGGEDGGSPDGTVDGGTEDGGTDAGTDDGGLDDGGLGDGGGSDGGSPGCNPELVFGVDAEPLQELHVDPTGDDGADGTAGAPLQTIDEAVSRATPGTSILLHGASYPAGIYLDGLQGTADAPIWLGGAPGQAPPRISGGNSAIHAVRARYLILHDLEIEGSAQNGLNFDDGGDLANATATHHLVFQNLNVHDVGGGGNEDCLKLSGLRDFWVLDSSFARCGGGGSGSGIDMVGCHRGLILGNHFQDNSGNAIQAKGDTSEIEIRGNLIENPGARGLNLGGSTGYPYFRPPLSETTPNVEARDLRAVANVIVGGQAAIAFVGCVDCLAAHNTIIDPGRWVFRILQETVSDATYEFLPASNGRVVNNLIYFDSGALSTTVNVGPNTSPGTFTFESNLWYAHDNPGASQPSLPVTESGGIVGQDPELTDPTGGDFSVSSTGAAAGAGLAGADDGADRDGQCWDNPPTLGAHELP